MKSILFLITTLFTFNLYPSGSSVGNGFVDVKEEKAMEALCLSKGGKVEKETCVLKDKTINLKDLKNTQDEPKKPEGKK